jgi:hypothetical protein
MNCPIDIQLLHKQFQGRRFMNRHFSPTKLAFLAMLAGQLALSGCAPNSNATVNTQALAVSQANKAKAARDKRRHVTRTGEVILLRGLANIYSKGMDVIGDRLKKKGVDARVYNHAAWEDLAIDMVARSKRKKVSYPIIIMGHSLGGNASVQMATYLGKRGIPVSFVVAFDPTETNFAGPKVKKVVNYYLPNGKNKVRRGAGFNGTIANINVSNIPGIKHTTVEKTRKLQNQSINTVMKLVRKRRRRG